LEVERVEAGVEPRRALRQGADRAQERAEAERRPPDERRAEEPPRHRGAPLARLLVDVELEPLDRGLLREGDDDARAQGLRGGERGALDGEADARVRRQRALVLVALGGAVARDRVLERLERYVNPGVPELERRSLDQDRVPRVAGDDAPAAEGDAAAVLVE